jgi:hypothetical protein
MKSRQVGEANDRGELQATLGHTHGEARSDADARDRIGLAVVTEAVSGPFAGGGEIELVVAGTAFEPEKGFEAGVLP